MKLPCTIVWRLVQKENIRAHTSKISSSTLNANLVFEAMFDVVHIDEKWFYMTRLTQKYYLLPNEKRSHKTCQSKRFITKIMFMVAVARPRFDKDGNCLFDGKVGIFPFPVTAPARRASKNRVRGTLEVKSIESITKIVVKKCLLEKVILAIKAKWLQGANKRIFIQQDNTKPHIIGSDEDFVHAAKSDGFDMELIQQPPNSPDMNILDLGFFRSIQTLQHKKSSRSICQLLDSVVNAFDTISYDKLKHVWVSLQAYMNEVMRLKGSNSYPLPHLGKNRMVRLGNWENQLKVNVDNIAIALNAITKEVQEISQQQATISE
ncbi:hypothetical protein RND81_04G027500 [Saponaria officinalis]|uniref:Transposase n=1 Tax=Saponaria officinalis TaxID=3572 RepID=A0AAW1LCF6_SAPOF